MTSTRPTSRPDGTAGSAFAVGRDVPEKPLNLSGSCPPPTRKPVNLVHGERNRRLQRNPTLLVQDNLVEAPVHLNLLADPELLRCDGHGRIVP